MTTRIHVHTGGPFHPSAAQFKVIARHLGEEFSVVARDGARVFDELDDCDLFVAAGMHWTGMDDLVGKPGCWPKGVTPTSYSTPTANQRAAFRDYVSSGRPVLNFHGGIASYDDWPEYGRLLGVQWHWKVSNHGARQEWTIAPVETDHPIMAGITEYQIVDEIYGNLQFAPELPFEVHATATVEHMRFPMVITAEGGRIPGAGRMVYLANGHDEVSLECGTFIRLIINSIHWLTGRRIQS